MTAASRSTLDAAYANTLDIYRRQADGWDAHRHRIFFEKPWIDRLLGPAPAGLRVLDLGCGAGDPISGYMIERGVELTGLDGAKPMLDLASSRYPNASWVHADMRDYAPDQTFDRILSWDGSFHLTQDEQRALLSKLPGWLDPGGGLLVTIGHEAGEVTGTVEGETVYHSSLEPDEYRDRLEAGGMRIEAIVLEDRSIDFHSLVLARKA
ncbi:class I SAM-dependent methyltransferase [Maricaulaceae bacterium EIL42A08]|nr:class I SAM-dependent methyltransferase [Maricaulaceae bacterium EIL42A08]